MSLRMSFCQRLLLAQVITVFVVIILLWLITRDSSPSSVTTDPASFPLNNSLAEKIMETLCSEYAEGQVSGDLCSRMCHRPIDKFNDVHVENKVVLVVTISGQKMVLKAQRAYSNEFDDPEEGWNEEQFEDRVRQLVDHNLQLDWPSSRQGYLMDMLWPMRERTVNMSNTDRRSLWSLLAQEEYVTLRVLSLARVFPKVVGTCGHFYAVEYLVPFHLKSYYSNLRAKILVHIMGTLKLFLEFLNEPLHWCDVKFDNFGLSAEYPKRFVVMDADMVFTESRMNKLLTSLHCRTDSDCNFLDCVAKCDLSTHYCTTRVNDNIDVFCAKLIHQLFGSFWTKNNRYLAVCHEHYDNATTRRRELHQVMAWNLHDV